MPERRVDFGHPLRIGRAPAGLNLEHAEEPLKPRPVGADPLHGMSDHRATLLRLRAAVLLLCAICAIDCAPPPERDPWPAGALFVGRRDSVDALLGRLALLEGTPLAERARALRASLPDCAWVESRAPDGAPATLLENLSCRARENAFLDGVRGDHDLLLALPVENAGRVVGLARLVEGDLSLELRWSEPKSDGPLALLVPGAEPVGPALLSDANRLVHLHVRPERGIDLAALVPAGSQADRLFRLRTALFTDAILDGSYEAAVYLPPPVSTTPQAVLALGFGFRSAAVAAAERFVAELSATWQVARSDFVVDEARGACLPGLNVLPDLAPCYVVTDHALVVGWNPASVRHALGAPPVPEAAHPARLEFDLALFASADEILSRHLPPQDRPRPTVWPWERAIAHAEREAGELVLHLRLEAPLDS
jgi:hypothetical protein